MIKAGAIVFVFVVALLLGAPAPAQTVRIGVFGLFHPAELSVAPMPGSSLVMENQGESVTINQAVHAHLAGGSIQLPDPNPRALRRLERRLERNILRSVGMEGANATGLADRGD